MNASKRFAICILTVFLVFHQCCFGADQPLRAEFGVGGGPARPPAAATQTPGSPRRQAWPGCGGGELVRTGKCPLPLVQEEDAAPPGQKAVSDSLPTAAAVAAELL